MLDEIEFKLPWYCKMFHLFCGLLLLKVCGTEDTMVSFFEDDAEDAQDVGEDYCGGIHKLTYVSS